MNWKRIDSHAWASHDGKWRVSHSLANKRHRYTLWQNTPESENPYERTGWIAISNFDTLQLAQDSAEQIANDRAVLPKDYEQAGI